MLSVAKGFSRHFLAVCASASLAGALNNVILFSARILLRAAPSGNVTKVGYLVLLSLLGTKPDRHRADEWPVASGWFTAQREVMSRRIG
jgi:hypothetical protein